MSITGMINTAVTGLFTSQAGLRNTSNNIANVNTDGYARQVVRQENLVAGGETIGVRVANVERIVDRFLRAANLGATADLGAASASRTFHDRLQSLLGRPDSGTGLTGRMDSVFRSFQELTLNPADRIGRQASLSALDNLTREISTLADDLQKLRTDASNRIGEAVNEINSLLERVHDLNVQVVRQKGLNNSTAGLETQRDQAVAQLSSLIDIRTQEDADGTLNLLTTTGRTLLDRNLNQLSYANPGAATPATNFPPITLQSFDATGNPVGTLRALDHEIASGELRGLLDLRDKDIRNLSLNLGGFAGEVMQAINAVHNSHSAVPAPNVLTGPQTFVMGTDAPGFTGQTTFAVMNENNELVQKVSIDFDGAPPADMDALVTSVNAGLGGAGTLSFTDGVLSFSAANAAHGVVIADDPVAPTDRGGQNFSQFFGMNNLLEASQPGLYQTGLTGAETSNLAGGPVEFNVLSGSGKELARFSFSSAGATWNDVLNDLNAPGGPGDYFTFGLDADGAMQVTPKAGFEDVRLNVLSDATQIGTTGVTLTQAFGIDDRFLAGAAVSMQVRSEIMTQPERFALAGFDHTAAAGTAALSSGDQAGVLALAELETALNDFRAAGEMPAISATLGNYAASFLSNAGLMGARAREAEGDVSALQSEIQAREKDVSGVNLDEELANMIILQNSYNAAARLLQAAQEVMDTLIERT